MVMLFIDAKSLRLATAALLFLSLILNGCNSEGTDSKVGPRKGASAESGGSGAATTGSPGEGGAPIEPSSNGALPTLPSGEQTPSGPLTIVHVPQDAKGLYLTFNNNAHRNNFKFHCPGDSVYSGVRSTYDGDAQDRKFSFYCQFMQDSRGLALRKNNCQVVTPPSQGLEKNQKFSCPSGTFLAGEENTFDGTSGDRFSRYECCELHTSDAKKVVIDESREACSSNIGSQFSAYTDYASFVNDEANPWQGDLDYSCRFTGAIDPNFKIKKLANTVLFQISSRYNSIEKDRRFSFKCCSVKLEKSE